MKAMIHISMESALKRGSNKYGNLIVEFDPADLTEQQREVMALMKVKDDAFDVSKIYPQKGGWMLCPGEIVDNSLDELKAALNRYITLLEQEKAKEAEKTKAYTEEFLSKPDDKCIERRFDADYFKVGAYPLEYADKTDPRMVEKLARLEKLAEEKTIEYRAKQAEEKAAAEKRRKENEVKEAAAWEQLKAWGIENGSELLRLRIEEDMNWKKLGKSEFIRAHAPEGYAPIDEDAVASIKDRTNPQVEEIQELRRLRQLCEESNGILRDPELAWYVMEVEEPDEDDYDYESPEPEKFAVARVRVYDPTGDYEWAEKRFGS